MKKFLCLLCGFIALRLISSVAVAQDIEVPNGSYTNSITLDGGEAARDFRRPPPVPGDPPAIPDAPELSTNFSGTTNNRYMPPDTMGAVGTNRLMIMVNGEVRIQDRSGNLIAATTLNSFWGGAGSYSDSTGNFVFDPHVIYDPYNNRWIAIAAAHAPPSATYAQLLIGVSATSDPGGAWYQYAYIVDSQARYYADYPLLGFNKDKVVVTFTYASVTNLPDAGTGLAVFDKNSLYSGATPVWSGQTLSSVTYPYQLQPAFTYDTNIAAVYMVGTVTNNIGGQGRVRLYSITGSATNPVLTTVGTVQATAWARKFSTDTAKQKGSSVKMNTLDDRMYQAVYRAGSIWCAHTICLPSTSPTRSAVQFWQLATNAAVTQQGIIQDTGAVTNYAFPSIAVNRFGDAMIGFANFSTNHYPSASYTAQFPVDQRGNFQSVAMLKAGVSPYVRTDSFSRNRWGDYTSTQVDPVNDTDFWTLQEYADQYSGTLTNGSGKWALWWGNLVLPIPGNDAFSNAYTITGLEGNTNGTTLRATRETSEPNHAGVTNSPSVWYKWVAPSNGMVTLDVRSNVVQMILAVYTGSNVSSLTLVTNSMASPPKTTFNAVSNTTYRIAVAGNSGAQGDFTLNWLRPSAPVFLTQPATTNVVVGETFSLVSLAIGTPDPDYQWRKEGTNVLNATNTSLTITNVQFSNGTNYTVVATNVGGSVTSSVAAVIIWPDSSARLGPVQITTNGQFIMQVAGLTNRPYRIESSTNLGSTNWVPIFTNFVSYWYTNSTLTNDAQRFYRAITN